MITVVLTEHEARALARSAEFMGDTLADFHIQPSFSSGQSALELAQAKLDHALERELAS